MSIKTRTAALIVALCMPVVLIAAAWIGGYQMNVYTFEAGHQTGRGDGYEWAGTVGQSLTGKSTGGGYELQLGYEAVRASVALCAPPSPPLPELSAAAKNRFVSFIGGNAGASTAIRITFVDLPSPYDAWNSTSMWVGEPQDVSEIGGLNDATPPTFKAALLQCAPHYTDWSLEGTVHAYHEGIVPDGVYAVQTIDENCPAANEASFSSALTLVNSSNGDVCGAYQPGQGVNSWGPPDTSVDLGTDLLAAIDKFRSTATAPIKARADVEPATPDLLINITDATQVIDAFRGLVYPFAPGSPPCAGP